MWLVLYPVINAENTKIKKLGWMKSALYSDGYKFFLMG